MIQPPTERATESSPQGQSRWRNRLPVLAIFVIGFMPILLSYGLYLSLSGGTPWGTVNQGQFLQPPVPEAALALRDPDGAPLTLASAGHWVLVLAAAADCDADCAQALHMLRQLHVLLNRDARRVQRALVLQTPVAAARWQQWQETYPALTLAWAAAPEAVQLLPPGAYVLDPHGQLILGYSYAQVGDPLLDDIKRLLKSSAGN